VIVTGHQAFFTREALAAIARITLQNIADLEAGRPDPARLVKAAEAIAPPSRQLSQRRQRLAAEG